MQKQWYITSLTEGKLIAASKLALISRTYVRADKNKFDPFPTCAFVSLFLNPLFFTTCATNIFSKQTIKNYDRPTDKTNLSCHIGVEEM